MKKVHFFESYINSSIVHIQSMDESDEEKQVTFLFVSFLSRVAAFLNFDLKQEISYLAYSGWHSVITIRANKPIITVVCIVILGIFMF